MSKKLNIRGQKVNLYAPGERQGSRAYVVRFSICNKRTEISTGTTDYNKALSYLDRYFAELQKIPIPRSSERITVNRAAELYSASKNLAPPEVARFNRLKSYIGKRYIDEIRPIDIDNIANKMYPHGTAASKNRQVYTPISSLIRFGANNGWCTTIRITRLKEPTPNFRDLSQDQLEELFQATDGELRYLMIFLLNQGPRISDALRIDWSRVDMRGKTYEMYVSKKKKWSLFSLSHDAYSALEEMGPKNKGRVFSWVNRWAVYRDLRKVKLTFRMTPHMLRHTMATLMANAGVDSKGIMESGDWNDVRSVFRYTGKNITRQVAARAHLPKLLNKKKRISLRKAK